MDCPVGEPSLMLAYFLPASSASKSAEASPVIPRSLQSNDQSVER